MEDEELVEYGRIMDAFGRMARDWYGDLIKFGLTPQAAGSVVARIMLQQAWGIAGVGKIMSGAGAPDPQLFVEAARAAVKTVRFEIPDEIEPQSTPPSCA